ncbi:MAG: OmpA family protein [Bacteroidota bacterium]
MKILVTITLLLLGLLSAAQEKSIKIHPQDSDIFTKEKIVEDLIAFGLEVQEVRSNFGPQSHAMGFFIDEQKNMGLYQGMILSTGIVTNIQGQNTGSGYTSFELSQNESQQIVKEELVDQSLDTLSIVSEEKVLKVEQGKVGEKLIKQIIKSSIKKADIDLTQEVGGFPTFDARVLEIDFIPTADTLYYRYVFASEEYDEFVCSRFNDVFAFYLYREGEEKENIALIPNSKMPVAINSVNRGNPYSKSCQAMNPHLFQTNDGNQGLIFDGFTKTLDIRAKVVPGQKYTIKMAIADASDMILDSAVLVENESIFTYYNSFELSFELDSHVCYDLDKMKSLLQCLNENPKRKVQLIGHTDFLGKEDYNLNLSKMRVTHLKDFLEENGIKKDRIREVYKGESMPRYSNNKKNRRVEAFILG